MGRYLFQKLLSLLPVLLGISLAAFVLVGCWLAVTLWALATPSLRHLDEEGAPHGSQRGQAGVAATGGKPESAL